MRIGRAIFCAGWFVAFCVASLVLSSGLLHAAETDFSRYTRAADYCRGNVPRPMALSPDKRILCFDGSTWRGLDYSLAASLEKGGLFVVRSPGGDAVTAMNLANVLNSRYAVIVVYDYCLSACADALLFASDETFVLRDAIVAWHDTVGVYACPFMADARDHGPKRLEKTACSDAPAEYRELESWVKRVFFQFFVTRIIDPDFEMPPESVTMRHRLRSMFEGTGTYPDNLLWTWNPRYYPNEIRPKVVYERYPESEDEFDAMMTRFPWIHVIYDP
jgi:hypothetical protein